MFLKGQGWEGGKKEIHANRLQGWRNENNKKLLSFFKRSK